MNDPIADMLTRIRNAGIARHAQFAMPTSKMREAIAKILKEEGFVEDFESYEEDKKKYLLISLKYTGKTREPVIFKIERISKPGLRVYSSSKKLPKVLDNLGIAIVSTSKGVMTNLKAKELGIGGEILCYIW
mgnify:CR=1 FL=1